MSLRKQKIALIDPEPFAHSAGYFKAALACPPEEFPFEIHVYAALQNNSKFDTESVLQDACARGYKCEFFFKESITSSRIIQALKAPVFLRWANNLARRDAIDHVYFLSLDSILGWLISPFKSHFFPKIASSFSGIIFNATAFSLKKQSSWKKKTVNFYDRLIFQKADSHLSIKNLDFLDHGISKLFNKGRPSIDPWTNYKRVSKASARNKLSIDPGKRTTVLSLGVHHTRKGTEWLIDSLTNLATRGDTKWHLILAGPIPKSSKTKIEHCLSEMNNQGITSSVFNYFIEDSATWFFYQASDIFVAPYINFEGSSNASIRACAAGIPIIVSKNETMVAVIKKHGCGEIINSYTEDSLSECLSIVRNQIVKNPNFYLDACRSYADFHSEANFRRQIFNF
jgi:glycosyltransferase involved in cell wall biosynthesis